MCILLHKYDINIIHIPGKDIVIADALNEDFQDNANNDDIIPDVIINSIDYTRYNSIKKRKTKK